MKPHRSKLSQLALLLVAGLGLGAGPAAERGEVRRAPFETAGVHRDAVPKGPSVAERVDEIRRRVQAALVYPPSARARGQEGVARVRFAIRRDGRAESLELSASTGHRLLDRAAEQSVRAAAPLPWVHGRLEIPVRFALEARRP